MVVTHLCFPVWWVNKAPSGRWSGKWCAEVAVSPDSCRILPYSRCLIIGISCKKSALKTEFHFFSPHVSHRWKDVFYLLHWYFFIGQLGSHGPKNLEILLWIYPSVQLFQIYCHMLAFSAAPPVLHVVSSLRCAEWLHESVNVINVIHYWQDCSSSHCSWFHHRNASSKAELLFIYSRGFCDFTISLASSLFINY